MHRVLERLVPPWDSIEIKDWRGGEATKMPDKHQQRGDLSQEQRYIFALNLVRYRFHRCLHVKHQEPDGFTDSGERPIFILGA